MIIKKIKISKFRGFKNAEFEMGKNITVIAGQNGTQKTTLLGMISQPFSVSKKDNSMFCEKPLSGGNYKSGFSEKFKLSEQFDRCKEHEWTLVLEGDNEEFTVESMYRDRSKNDGIRFWRKGTRRKGSGYIQTPVIFLSLSRLLPLGEDFGINRSVDVVLSESELKFYEYWHNRILIIPNVPLTGVDYLSSAQKNTLGANTALYDWKMNSAGQDNIGKILLAVLSFKRLKERYLNIYEGGVLVIDELDATLYPASQVQLMNAIRKFSSDYKVQFAFTTHSLNILNLACEWQDDKKLNGQVKVVFLEKVDDRIGVFENVDFDHIRIKLNNVMLNSPTTSKKIHCFTEDKEAVDFAKAIIGGKVTGLKFVDCTFGCKNLLELVRKSVPGFRTTESIIMLDGDAYTGSDKKIIDKNRHILVLPGDLSPERLLAKFLDSLSDEDPRWDEVMPTYRKQIVFADVQLQEILNDRKKAKNWYVAQKKILGRNISKLIRVWATQNKEICDEFIGKLKKSVSYFK